MDSYKAIKPDYYRFGKFQVFDIIDGFQLDFYKGTAVKYICRAGRKPGNSEIQDLRKAVETLQHRINQLEGIVPVLSEEGVPSFEEPLTEDQKKALEAVESGSLSKYETDGLVYLGGKPFYPEKDPVTCKTYLRPYKGKEEK